MKRCLPLRIPKDSLRVSASVQSRLLLALKNTIKRKPNCQTGATLRTCTCNNVQLQRFMPTKAQKINSANYLHLQTAQLLRACQQRRRKNQKYVKQLLSKSQNQIVIEVYLIQLSS